MSSIWKKYRWKLWIPILPMIVLVLLTLDIMLYHLPMGPVTPALEAPPSLHGAYHVPSKDLEGRQRTDQVLREVKEAGLDFVVLVDPNQEPSRNDVGERRGLQVIPALSLAAGTKRLVLLGEDAQRKPGESFEDSRAEIDRRLQAGLLDLGILASPMSGEHGWPPGEVLPSLRRDNQERLIDRLPRLGIEILHVGSQHENEFQSYHLPVLWGGWAWLFNRPYAVMSFYDRPDTELDAWDRLNVARPEVVTGYCAIDAQAKLGDHNDLALRTVGTWIPFPDGIPDSPEARQEEIIRALRHGHFYCAVDLLAPALGFTMHVEPAKGDKLRMGDLTTWAPGMTMKVQAPKVSGQKVRISIFHDGQPVLFRVTHSVEFKLERPGTYRVEVDLQTPSIGLGDHWSTWIYSNPIKLRDPNARRNKPKPKPVPAVPEPPEPPPARPSLFDQDLGLDLDEPDAPEEDADTRARGVDTPDADSGADQARDDAP